MHFLSTPDMGDLAVATVAAFILGFLVSWVLDRLIFKRVVDDRVAGIALSCALTFAVMMGAMTVILTRSSPVEDSPIIVPPVGYAISFVVGLMLVGILRMRMYSTEYEHNDDQAVFDVDDSDPAFYDAEVLAWDEKHGHKGYIRRHWAGHLSLPVAYWVNGAMLSVVVVAVAELLTRKLSEQGGSLRSIAMVSLLYIVVSSIIWIWSSVGIWRSAYWHRRRGGLAGWGFAARTLVFISAALTIFRSEGLALQAAEFGHLAMGNDSLGELAEMSVSPDGRELLLRGNIAQGAAVRFGEVLRASPSVETVILTSRGGRMLEAERMAALIRKESLATRVDDYCMSACTSLLLAGRDRSAPNRARIGFHQPSFPGTTPQEMQEAAERMRSDYLAAGIDPAFVRRALATPANDMWFPGPDELVAAGVLSGSEIVVGGGGGDAAASGGLSLSEQRLRDDLKAEAARINASAPIKLDTATTLDRAVARGLKLTSFYTIHMEGLDIPASRSALTRQVDLRTCSDPGLAAIVRDGGEFVYSYHSAKGKYLFEVAVSDCSAS